MEMLTIRNPANGHVIESIPSTDPKQIHETFVQAKIAQRKWYQTPLDIRMEKLRDLQERLIEERHDLSEIIVKENGKPAFEALTNEIFPTVELISFFASNTQRVLKTKNIPLRLMRHRRSTLSYEPLGTVLIISPWNYP
ncbi:MAG: aldehyde dehydrogenase family protein, partial [Proteobacteria bacterium]